MALYKDHHITLDLKRTPKIALQNIVAGETGNRLIITLTNDDDPVTLNSSTYRVALRVASDLGVRRQDSATENSGISFSDGKATILLSKDSYTAHLNCCVLEVFTTENEADDTLVCSAEFQFYAKGSDEGENTGVSVPLLVQYEKLAKSWARGGTGTREGEDTDNAKFYSDIAREEFVEDTVNPSITTWLDDNQTAVESAIGDWLDDHPEATTTVQDGAITYAKLNSSVSGDIDDIKDTLAPNNIGAHVTFVSGKAINATTGESYNSANMSSSAYIDIEGINILKYSRVGVNTVSTPTHGVAFYTSSKTYISGITSLKTTEEEAGLSEYTVDVPPNAKYFRATCKTDWLSGFYLYDAEQEATSLVPRMAEAESEITNLQAVDSKVFPDKIIPTWTSGYYIKATSPNTGNATASENFSCSDFINILGMEAIRFTAVVVESSYPQHGMAFYDDEKSCIGAVKSLTGTDSSHLRMVTVPVPEGAMYARFSVRTENKNSFELYDAAQYADALETRIEKLENSTSSADVSDTSVSQAMQWIADRTNGKLNVVSRMRLLTDIEWTPLAPVPSQLKVNGVVTYGSFPAGETVKGFPYASQLKYELWIGKAVSFETFVSALANKESVIYDFGRVNETPSLYRPGAWYSTVCSKAVSYALNLKQNYASGEFHNHPRISLVANSGNYSAGDVQIGDIIERPNYHTAIITDIIYDTWGDVSAIEVSEAVTPSCRRRRWNVYGAENYFSQFDGYNLFRYADIDSVPPVDWNAFHPYVSKTLGLNFGNRANYLYGTDIIKVTLLQKPDDTLVVKKNGEQVSTVDVTDDPVGSTIVLSLSAVGMYSVNFDGGDERDAVSFALNDCTVSYDPDTTVLTFSSNTATIYQVGLATGSPRMHAGDLFPTSSDIANGYMTLGSTGTADYLHVFFKTPYGVFCKEIAL